MLMTHLKVSLLFSPEDMRPWYPTRMSNLDSSDRRTLFHFETVHFKWALSHRTQLRFWTIWLPFCIIELYLASADGTADCVYRQWFLEVFLGPFSNVNERIKPNFWFSVVWGPEDHGHPTKVFDFVPYTQRFLQFLWNFWWCYAL